MGIANKILPHDTYDDWIQWDGRWELLEGYPIAMCPMPLPTHQRVAAELIYEFIKAIKKKSCKACRVYDALDYKITEDTILVPDILIICGEIKARVLDFAPALVVEILSPSTALRDRNTKFGLYEQQGVKHYLIVDAEKQTIEVFTLTNGAYKAQTAVPYTFVLEADCSIQPDLSEIFS